MEHITSLKMTLRPLGECKFTAAQVFSWGPYMQGVLMRSIDSRYADELHGMSFNPYSQYCYLDEGGAMIWRVNALTDQAADRIIAPLQKLDSFEIHSAGVSVETDRVETESIRLKQLTDLIAADQGNKAFVQFITPASFKCQGSYVNMPSARLVLQNILMHYSKVYEERGEADQEMLDYIVEHTRITSYNLRSHYVLHVAGEGRKIPAFMGKMTFGVYGPSTMSGLVRMLLRFGEFSGVGIKTAMGMGGMRCAFSDKPARPSEG